MERRDQHEVLRWALDGLEDRVGPLPDLPLDRLHRALRCSGVGPLVERLARTHDLVLDPATATELDEQARAVARRHRRHLTVAPDVLERLDRAGCRVAPVNGIVLTSIGVWPWPTARPSGGIDLLVPAEQRGPAALVLESAGFACTVRSSTEDVYRARDDMDHGCDDAAAVTEEGAVRVQAGWPERLQGYNAVYPDLLRHAERRSFLGTNAWLLPAPWLFAQVLGRLSAGVIRRDVHPLHVIDVVLCLRWLAPSQRTPVVEAVGRLDARLSAPGLWLVDRYAPDDVARVGLPPDPTSLSPDAASWLERTEPFDVFRDAAMPAPWAWRAAFTRSPAEGASVMDAVGAPPTAPPRRAAARASGLGLYRRRLIRTFGRS